MAYSRAAATQLTSWSWSRYETYDQCPAKAKYSYLLKLPQEKSAALERGARVHDDIRDFTIGKTAKVPEEVPKAFTKDLKALRVRFNKRPTDTIIEDTWAYRADWSETVYNDWNGCSLRIKVDAAVIDKDTIVITDYKTGKMRPENQEKYTQQMQLYAVGALQRFGVIMPNNLGIVASDLRVSARLLYLDEEKVWGAGTVYTISDLPALKKEWEKRIRPMLNDKTFAPKPNRFCSWCSYSKAKGGPCKY